MMFPGTALISVVALLGVLGMTAIPTITDIFWPTTTKLDSPPDDNNDNGTVETNSSSNSSSLEVLTFPSAYEFKQQLSKESQSEVKRFLQRSCSGCGTDENWSPMRGSCLNYPNLASYHTGARVISAKSSKICPPEWDNNNPNTVLMETVLPGRAWAFQERGELDIQLTIPALIIGITIHHPPKSILIPGFFASAPKSFLFYGLRSETDEHPYPFGSYEYSSSGLAAQTFVVQNWAATPFPMVRLQVTSNHGNPLFTTLYKVEFHGIVIDNLWFMDEATNSVNDSKRLPEQDVQVESTSFKGKQCYM